MSQSRSRLAYQTEHPDALAVYCSDGRFTEAVEALLHALGYPRLDTLTIPGGPALLELTSGGFSAVETVRASTSFLIRGHAIKHVSLLAHQGCGYYRTRFAHDSPEYMLRRQMSDLRAAARWTASTHPGVQVESYYARVEDGVVVFDPVDP
jgi:hypothetical protein